MDYISTYLSKISKLVVEQRHALGISQEYLAELCKVHRNTIAVLELGESDPTIVTLTNIFMAFGIQRFIIDHNNCHLQMITGVPFVDLLESSIINDKIGFFIDSLRLKHNISRDKLSLATGIHRNTIARIENAQVTARLSTIIQIYRYFNVSEVYTTTNCDPNDCTFYGVTLRCIDISQRNSTMLINSSPVAIRS
ncbi:MAG TPA: helix-turn-helix transcriptional regulator [Spirochaetota bacterium]|nr:helix-turn-helix transcriptional regulator [Spirochaetota bacterium]HOM10960.1 helix-turn-helix transcriptional regulator [Spirochaetota bacterium]HPP50640.1 helix-turn-helix transcriptional regulator [Spirochaetota bacterium]HXK65200.1 helix-turn-helix transcriptional regulator [Spirochaetota bacterium]